MRHDRGSATVLWLAAISVVLVLGVVGLAVGEFSSGRARAASAADLGALAGADRALTGDQCAAARRVVLVNGAQLRACSTSGIANTTVTVEVEVRATGLLARIARMVGASPPRIRSRARAGQPSDRSTG